MSLKTAAFLALIGMLLLTVLNAATFLNQLTAYLHDAVAVMTLLGSAIHLFASLTVTIFLFMFYRAH
jgi:hypothetical protein